jgi:serine/threonine protein kinase/Tol biopolymer transport system component
VTLSPGTHLGSYHVIALLGTGGMGAVYRARDTRLNRDVAIKVLPETFAAGSKEDRLARFEREAQTLASLNHPNIAHIYGIVDLPDGGRGLVMEYVDGENLAARLTRGALPVDEAMQIARQIADALEAAHEHGIVHRDLKPANVMVNAEGVVKVLDFGLAKAADPSGLSAAGVAESPTFTAHMTQFGMIIGTAAYMSPEQARGKTVDRRADIWAFGVLLYEMITGRRAFAGEEMSDVLASVLRQDIDWNALPAGTPPRLRQLLERCLERDPKSRLRDIGEARVAIAKIESGAPDSSSVTVGPPSQAFAQRRRWAQYAMPVAITVLLTAAGMLTLLRPWSRPAASSVLTRMSLLPPPGAELYPDSTGVAISPDGTMVAFVVGGITRAETQMWVRSLASMTARRLDDADGASLPFWSPDSRHIGFFSGTKLKTVAASGGRAEIVCDAPFGRGGAWSASNVIVFAPDAAGPLFRVPATGGTPTPVTSLDSAKKENGHRFPAFLPDGDHFVYAVLPGHDGRFEIYAGSVSGSARARTHIGSMESAPVYAAPGWLLYARQGVLAAQGFDAASLSVRGDPISLDDEPSAIMDPAISFTAGRPTSVSDTGSLAYYSAPSTNTVPGWYDALGRQLGTLDLPAGHYDHVEISPDGTHAAFVRSVSPSESALWLVDLVRGSAVPLSSGKGRNDSPIWSPDGTRVVFTSDREGPQNLFVKTVGDATPEQPLYRSDVLFKNPSGWTPDGSTIVITEIDPLTSQNIWTIPSGGGAAKMFFAGPTRDIGGPVSPDGKWILYLSDQTGRMELYVQSFTSPGRQMQVSQGGAITMWWTRDSRQIFYLGGDLRTLWRGDVVPAGAGITVGAPVRLGVLPPNVVWVSAMPDRQKFLALTPERTGTPSMTVVENWRVALTR